MNLPFLLCKITYCRAPPRVSIIDYLRRVANYTSLTPPLLLSVVFYMDLLCSLYPEFIVSSFTVHRFLITAATVASKGLSDFHWPNKVYAKVGGVRNTELVLLERDFLHRVHWRILPDPHKLIAYYQALVERARMYVLEADLISETK
jgi:hypothetical protein